MSKDRKPVVTLTKDDFVVNYYTAGGPGGGGKDTSNTACRIRHKETGLYSESQVHRSQRQNKIAAFNNLIKQLMPWLKKRHYQKVTGALLTEDWVNQQMNDNNIIVETKVDGKWIKVDGELLTS